MAPRVGSGPGRALKIETLGVPGCASQEALEGAEEERDTISGTHNIEALDCHESRCARLTRGGKSTLLKATLFGLAFFSPPTATSVEDQTITLMLSLFCCRFQTCNSPFPPVIFYGLYTPSFTQISRVAPSFFYSTVSFYRSMVLEL